MTQNQPNCHGGECMKCGNPCNTVAPSPKTESWEEEKLMLSYAFPKDIRTEDGERIMTLLGEILSQTEKAYGGCRKCYGKGYATTIEYATSGMPDFGEDHGVRSTTKLPEVRPCSCDRGEQIKKTLAAVREEAKEEGISSVVESLAL